MGYIYEELNNEAKEYLIQELDKIFYKKYKDEKLLERCYKEINILYDKALLFIVKYLYKYKQKYECVSYHFEGTINNLLLLYVLDLTKVDPIKYNLPFELYSDKTIDIKLINDTGEGLANYFDKCDHNFKIVMGSHEKENIEKIEEFFDNHYLLIPSFAPPEDMLFRINSKYFMLETVEDYRKYTNWYLPIKISEKYLLINCENIGLENVVENDFEKEISNILKPQTIDDYIKIKSIARSVHLWKLNQDELVFKKILDIKSLIANKEDIFDYLINHHIDRQTALEIVKEVGNGYENKNSYLWNKYVSIMKENNCDDLFINVISKTIYIRGRGEAIGECLFVLDENNYIEVGL